MLCSGIRQHNPRKILLELYSWGVIKDELLGMNGFCKCYLNPKMPAVFGPFV